MREALVPKAVVWLLAGTDEDAANAERYAAANGEPYHNGILVFRYPTTQKDPLGCAKKAVLALTKK